MPLKSAKAYTVTISHTGKSLRQTNDVFFLGPSLGRYTGIDNVFPLYLPWFCRMLWWLSLLLNFRFLDKLTIALLRSFIKLLLFCCQKSLRDFHVWARDLRLSLHTAGLQIPTVCEVHKELSSRELKRVARSPVLDKLCLAPISQHLQSYLENHKEVWKRAPSMIMLPMAASPAFFSHDLAKVDFPEFEGIRIGYFGSYETMGIRSDLDKFIKSLIGFDKFPIQLVIVGVDKNGRDEISHLASELNHIRLSFEIHDRISHSDVPQLMRTCHILVLPYGENSINRGRFPIKLVEYAASRVPILCTNTQSHKEILGRDKAYFYDPDKPFTLLSAIVELITLEHSRNLYVENAFKWAQDLTYDNRAKRIKRVFLQLSEGGTETFLSVN